MSLFSKKKEPVTTLKVTRAPGDGPIVLEIDGATYHVDPGDFSKALATGATVIARRRVV